MTKHIGTPAAASTVDVETSAVDFRMLAQHTLLEYIKLGCKNTDWWNSTKTHALLSGKMFDSLNKWEVMRREWFPWMPKFDMEEHYRMKNLTARQLAVALGFYLDGLDVLQGKESKVFEHLKKFDDATKPVPIAQTPKELIWKKGIVELWYYPPAEGVTYLYKTSKLFYMAPMNGEEIYDLTQKESFVKRASGYFPTYMVKWGCPTPAEASWDFGTYAVELMPEIKAKVREHSGNKQIAATGWCLAAELLLDYVAKFPDEDIIASLMTVPGLFSKETLFGTTLSYFDEEAMLEANDGILPGFLLNEAAKSLKAKNSEFVKSLYLYLHLDDPAYLESSGPLESWLNKKPAISMAGGFHRQLRDLYLYDQLAKGTFIVGGSPVDLSKVRVPVVIVTAKYDHIVENWQSEGLAQFLKDCTVLKENGGHITLIFGEEGIKTQEEILAFDVAHATRI